MAKKRPPLPIRSQMFYDDPRRFPLNRNPRDPSERPSRFPSNIPPFITRRWLHWLGAVTESDVNDFIAEAYNIPCGIDELITNKLEELIFALPIPDDPPHYEIQEFENIVCNDNQVVCNNDEVVFL
jgi:hypothetical protein